MEDTINRLSNQHFVKFRVKRNEMINNWQLVLAINLRDITFSLLLTHNSLLINTIKY